jgi:hypothetical protein
MSRLPLDWKATVSEVDGNIAGSLQLSQDCRFAVSFRRARTAPDGILRLTVGYYTTSLDSCFFDYKHHSLITTIENFRRGYFLNEHHSDFMKDLVNRHFRIIDFRPDLRLLRHMDSAKHVEVRADGPINGLARLKELQATHPDTPLGGFRIHHATLDCSEKDLAIWYIAETPLEEKRGELRTNKYTY